VSAQFRAFRLRQDQGPERQQALIEPPVIGIVPIDRRDAMLKPNGYSKHSHFGCKFWLATQSEIAP
tara:strand:- start:258 stop:455 length:198 start_codon:yes stop_codon:yes gene_type:complete